MKGYTMNTATVTIANAQTLVLVALIAANTATVAAEFSAELQRPMGAKDVALAVGQLYNKRRKGGCESALDEYSLPETIIKDGRFSAPTDDDFDGEMLDCVEPWATMFAVERAIIRTPRERFTARVARAAARHESYEDFCREVHQLDLEYEIAELTQAVLENSDLFVDARGRVFTEEDALELDEMAQPVIHIAGSVFAGDEPAPTENIAEADEAEAFSAADHEAAGSTAHVKGGNDMSEKDARRESGILAVPGCVQIREVLGWTNETDGRPGIFNIALAGLEQKLKSREWNAGPVPATLDSWAKALEDEAARQAELMEGDEGAFWFSKAATDCRLTPMKDCGALLHTGIVPDGHFETGWLRVRHQIRKSPDSVPGLPKPPEAMFAVRETGDDGSALRYYAAVERLQRTLLDRMVYAGLTDGKQHYRLYAANAADLKAGKGTFIESGLYQEHESALNWGRTAEDWSRCGINGTELMKLRALELTPSQQTEQQNAIDIKRMAIVFNPEIAITLKNAYFVKESGSYEKRVNEQYNQTLWDGCLFLLKDAAPGDAAQIRMIFPGKGMVLPVGSIKKLKATGFQILDEIQVWDGWDEDGKPVFTTMRTEDIELLATESTIKGLKLWRSRADMEAFVAEFGNGTFLRLVRAVEEVLADPEENERRKASRSMMLAMLMGHPGNFEKLAARGAKKVVGLFDSHNLYRELAEEWKPEEERSGLALLLNGAGEDAMQLTNRRGEKFIQQLANDRLLECYKRSAISPQLGGGKYKAEYLYICHDRQAAIEYFLCGKKLDECGWLKAGQVGCYGFENGEKVHVARHPLNAAMFCNGVINNNPLFEDCGNFIELSIHDDFINRMDGDFDGDEAFITNDPVWVHMAELGLNKLGLYGVLFEHGKGKKYAVDIPEAVDVMFGTLSNGMPVWKSVSNTIWNGMEFDVVGKYANYAAKILNQIDAFELYRLAMQDSEAAIAALEGDYNYLRAVLCHVITILVIDSMKTEKAPKEAFDAVAKFADEYSQMPYTQRFVKGSCKASTIYEDGSEDPAAGCEYPFWSPVWGNPKAVDSHGKKVKKATAKMGKSGADLYCCSFMQLVTRELREKFGFTMNRSFFEDVAHYRTYVGEIAAKAKGEPLPTFKWTLLYDIPTWEDGREWNRITNGRDGFPKMRNAALPAGHQRTEFVSILRGRGLANDFDRNLVDKIERGEAFGVDALLKLLHHQKAKLAMENADDKARSVDARIDIGIQTRVALSIVRTFLELRDENGQLFQPWLKRYVGEDGHLDDRAMRSLANTMIRFVMDSSADPHEGRHGFFGFLLDLFGGIWGENAKKNLANEELAKKILESSELRAELEEDPEAEAVTETPDPDWNQLFVPAEAEDFTAPEQPAPTAQAVSHTTTTEGGIIMKVTIIDTANNFDVPVTDAEQAYAIAKAYGSAMGFVAEAGNDFLAVVATSVTAEVKAAITAGKQQHGFLYAWPKDDKANAGNPGTAQTQQPTAKQPAVQQQPAVSTQPVNPVNNGIFKMIVVGTEKFDNLAVVEKICDHAISSVILTKKIIVLDWRAGYIGSRYAAKKGLRSTVYNPDFSGCTGLTGHDLANAKSLAAKKRNEVMAAAADAIVAFWDGVDKNVAHIVRMAMNAGIKVRVCDLQGKIRAVGVNGANMLAMYDAARTIDTSVSQRAAAAIAATKPAPEPAAAPAVDDIASVNDRINSIIEAVRAIDSNHGGQLRKIISKLDDAGRRDVLALMMKRDTVALAAMKKGFGTKILSSIEQAVITINAATK